MPALREWGEDGVSISLPGSDRSAWLGVQDEGQVSCVERPVTLDGL